jgi:hypothetical protein
MPASVLPSQSILDHKTLRRLSEILFFKFSSENLTVA